MRSKQCQIYEGVHKDSNYVKGVAMIKLFSHVKVYKLIVNAIVEMQDKEQLKIIELNDDNNKDFDEDFTVCTLMI